MGWGRAFVRVQQTLRARDHKARDLQAAVAPATVGLGLRCNVHRPHAGGSPSARRPASEGGSRYWPHPCESRPRVSHADGGNGGRVAWRAGGCFIPQGPSTSSSQSRDGVVELRSGFVGVRVLVGWWGGVASRHCLAGRPGACAFVGYLRSDPRSPISLMLLQVRGCVRVGWSRASYSLFVLSCARCLVWVVI